jgi:hypothetical protein
MIPTNVSVTWNFRLSPILATAPLGMGFNASVQIQVDSVFITTRAGSSYTCVLISAIFMI